MPRPGEGCRSSGPAPLGDRREATSPAGPSAPAGLYIGTSGWAYPTWKPAFYPAGTPAKRLLSAYSARLNSVEVNYTFRTLPTLTMLDGWLSQTPADFRFSFKAPQRITHFARLRASEPLVQSFVEALAPVRDAGRLGLLLFQLPPNLPADLGLLRDFLALPVLRAGPALRIAFEFRHASWLTEPVFALLHESDTALCIAETDDLQTPEVHPALSYTSFRLRRSGGYSHDELRRFAERFVRLSRDAAQPREVFLYLKHEDQPTGALNATELLALAASLAPAPLRREPAS